MSKALGRALNRNRDVPLTTQLYIPGAAGGTGADYEHAIAMVPNGPDVASTGFAQASSECAMTLRNFYVVPEASITGGNTNNYTWYVYQKRAGALLINSTSSTAVAAPGTVTITPGAMTNISNGTPLSINGGVGTAEIVVAVNVTATTFDATFANTHSGTYNVQSVPVCSLAFVSGTNAAALTPKFLSVPYPVTLLPGDILTFARTSNNATGIATPICTVVADWIPAGIF